ncbi:MAG: PTS glucitol/sorbitol transporter subunit IIA [Bacilli bacterium]
MMKSRVTFIGSLAFEFEDDMVIVFFGPKAPQALRDVSIIHEGQFEDLEVLSTENKIVIDGFEYDILSVGSEACHNFRELGHVSLYFAEPPSNILPGSVYVKPFVFPRVQIGASVEVR